MLINFHKTHNQKIRIVEILSELTGNEALRLQRFVYGCLDEGKCYFLIDLKHVRIIDSLGFTVLEYFIDRGVHVRFFNVDEDVRWMMRLSGKEANFKIYNESDLGKVVSMFEREIFKDEINIDEVKLKRDPRINTFTKVDFKYQPGHDGVISGRASILNLSEGEILADILAIETKIEDIAGPQDISGLIKLYIILLVIHILIQNN